LHIFQLLSFLCASNSPPLFRYQRALTGKKSRYWKMPPWISTREALFHHSCYY